MRRRPGGRTDNCAKACTPYELQFVKTVWRCKTPGPASHSAAGSAIFTQSCGPVQRSVASYQSRVASNETGVRGNCVASRTLEIGDRKMPAYVAPLELIHRRARAPGRDYGGRKLLEPGSLRLRRAAEEVPEAPADLGATGHAFWERLWSSCDWSSPVTDHEAVAAIARLMDDQEIARCRATRTADSRELGVVIALSRALSSSLASLGWNLG